MYLPTPSAIVGVTLGSMSKAERTTWHQLGCNAFANTLHLVRKQMGVCSAKECPPPGSRAARERRQELRANERVQSKLDAAKQRLPKHHLPVLPAPTPGPAPQAPQSQRRARWRHPLLTAAQQQRDAARVGSRRDRHKDKVGEKVFDAMMVALPLVACIALRWAGRRAPAGREQAYHAVELGEFGTTTESFVSAGYYDEQAAAAAANGPTDSGSEVNPFEPSVYNGGTGADGLPTI
jgi:hypothetical protein